MLSPPAALSTDDLVDTLAAGWGLRVASLDYRAVGFGSHHWAVVAADGARWFVTVDELEDDTFDRLTASLSTARALRAAGREFVVALHTGDADDAESWKSLEATLASLP